MQDKTCRMRKQLSACVIHDHVRDSIWMLLQIEGYAVRSFASCAASLGEDRPGANSYGRAPITSREYL